MSLGLVDWKFIVTFSGDNEITLLTERQLAHAIWLAEPPYDIWCLALTEHLRTQHHERGSLIPMGDLGAIVALHGHHHRLGTHVRNHNGHDHVRVRAKELARQCAASRAEVPGDRSQHHPRQQCPRA